MNKIINCVPGNFCFIEGFAAFFLRQPFDNDCGIFQACTVYNEHGFRFWSCFTGRLNGVDGLVLSIEAQLYTPRPRKRRKMGG